jgi:trk system potassium uptake protein TrkH
VDDQLKEPVKTNPAAVIAVSFLGTILLGTVVLELPVASADGTRLRLLDALFTATSAVCVTGLTVLDTGTRFSRFGQGVILFLIQVGGLGIMTFSTLFTILLGKKLSLSNRLVVQDALDCFELQGIRGLIKRIILITLILETIGAVFLFWGWRAVLGTRQALDAAVFHSVSAFCNAGFSLFSQSIVPYRNNYMILISITTLIILGGIGFVVLLDLEHFFLRRKLSSIRKITYHSRIVLLVTFALLLSGMIVVLTLEWDYSLRSLGAGEKLLNSFLESATCRTAGFNSLPTGLLHPSTLTFFMFLMFVGASPGSTGGGIKTTTFAIMLSTVKSMAYGENEVTLFKRAIPKRSVRRAISISGFAFVIVFFFALVLMMIETNNPAIPEKNYFLSILFEVVSAFGTVGLSTGVTPCLSDAGRFFIVVVMFIGRIGPLTLALAIGNRKMPPTLRYTDAQISVG